MSDGRELLKLAAKAAFGRDCVIGIGVKEFPDLFMVGGENWNPLTDDGDALRLAVKIGVDVVYDPAGARVYKGTEFWREDGADRIAATRRAIVRAAAEIGRTAP